MLNVEAIRKDFPFLKEGRVYLDSTASSLTPDPVIQKMIEYYHDYRANVGRGIYRASQRATDEFEAARERIARFIGAGRDELILLRNSSEALNLIANGVQFKRGDRVVLTIQEHHSNFVIWQRAKERFGLDLRIVNSDRQGFFNLSDFEAAIDGKTRLVSIAHVSNVLGVRLPVKEVAKLAHEQGSLVAVDGAQSVPHTRVDVGDLGCDFFAFSGHKMCGPTGAGGLFIRGDLQESVEPLCVGGGTIEDVGIDHYRLRRGPYRYEAGTPAIAESIGLGAAADYLSSIGMQNISDHEHALTRRMMDRLPAVPGLHIYGPPNACDRAGIFSFNVEGMNSHDVALALDSAAGIMVRSGHHCALPLMKGLLGVAEGSVRASVYLYNTLSEVDLFVDTLSEIAKTIA
jgi:cysteine desulfurase/selenocysteine lyase